MSQTWDETGHRHPVTVVAVPPLVITRVKTIGSKDGYAALQVGITHLRQTATKTKLPLRHHEIRLSQATDHQVGQVIPVSQVFQIGDQVTVSGRSKGHGFTGAVKRWGFKGGPRTHGQSDRERAPGSIGQGTSPGRVHKGKHMAGHQGNQRFSIKNLRVIQLDETKGTLWLSGPIPGPTHTLIALKKTGTGTYKPYPSKTKPEATPKVTTVSGK